MVAFRALTEANNTDNSGTLAITVPALAVEGDLLVLMVTIQTEDAPLTNPSGWTLYDSTSLTGSPAQAPTTYIYTRSATASGAGSAGSSVTLTPSATGRKKAVIIAYSGASGLGVFAKNSSYNSATGVAAPSITLSASTSWLLCHFSAASAAAGAVLTPDAPLTLRSADSHTYTQVAIGDQVPGTGATGTRTATASGNASAPPAEIAYSIEVLNAGPTTPARTAALTGTGSFAATARKVASAAAALTGAGAFAAGGVPVVVSGASLAGAGEFSAVAYAVGGAIPAEAPLEGSGELSAVATAVEVRSSALSGSGALSAAATAIQSAAAPLVGAGEFSATASKVGEVTADLLGSGAFSASAVGETQPFTNVTERGSGRSRSGLSRAAWEPAVVPPPHVVVDGEHRTIRASAFGPVTMFGTQPIHSTSAASAPRLRTRILMGGRDVSFYLDVPTPEPEWQLAEPLLWGPSSVTFPQIPAAYANPGVGDLRWCAKGKPVTYQRVDAAGNVVAVDYRGVVVAHDLSGKSLTVEVGGHAQGRAAMRWKPGPIFRDTLDFGRLAWAAVRDLGLRFEPRLGPTTGIKSAVWGSAYYIDYIGELCAKAQKRDGTRWTIMPDETGTYSLVEKDTETIHWTVFNDDARNVAELRSDASEEYDAVYGTGVTPRGQRVRNSVVPGARPGKPAPYPFDDNRNFTIGTTDEDTDTGDGISVMLNRLWVTKYLSLEDKDGTFDGAVLRALRELQEDSADEDEGLFYDGMTPDLWDALFDIGGKGFSIRGAQVLPMAQTRKTQQWYRSGSGQPLRRNPKFDRTALRSDRAIDFGSGFTIEQMRTWARGGIHRGGPSWTGVLRLRTGGVLSGQVEPGATITEADVADVRAIRPGHNVYLPMFAGGITVHVGGVEIGRDDSGLPTAELTVDTKARDAMEVWEVITRNRDTRAQADRRWKGNRAAGEVKDSIVEWDGAAGGVVWGDQQLSAGWNVIPVFAGQEGTVSRLRLLIQDVDADGGEVVITGREFACAIFGKKVTPKRLRTLIGNPLAASKDSTADPDPDDIDPPATDPEAGDADPGPSVSPSRPWWEREGNVKALRKLGLLHAEGTNEEPCGYSPGRKSAGGVKTGLHTYDSGFAYRTGPHPVLYLAIWVWGERRLSGGRVMWNQLEAGA